MTRLTLPLLVLLPLSACIVRDRPGDRVRGGNPDQVRHDASDAIGGSGSDTGADTATDTNTDSDTGADTSIDTSIDTAGDTGTDTSIDTSDGRDTATDTGSDTAVDTAVDTDCTTTALRLSDLVVDAGADGWTPGETASVSVTITNASASDFLTYPGVRFSADRPQVVSTTPSNYFYALFAGQSGELAVYFLATADAAPGAVTLTAEVHALSCDSGGPCPPACPITVTTEIVAPAR